MAWDYLPVKLVQVSSHASDGFRQCRRYAPLVVLAIVVAAQFMFGVDAFVVNVAPPTIAVELHASAAQIEAVIAIYLIAYATLVVTGGRLGDIYGTRPVFFAGVLAFTLTSLWCGLAQSGLELILTRLAQRATRDRISGLGKTRLVCIVCNVRARDCDQHRISDVDASRCGLNASRFA